MSPRVLFEQELMTLRSKIADMGARARYSYDRLQRAVQEGDRETLDQLLDNDRQMTDMLRSIEANCLELLTRQQPVARDLRTVSAALKVVTDIERVGDHVSDLAELFLRRDLRIDFLEKEPLLAEMISQAGQMLSQAVKAFVQREQETAKMVIALDDVVDNQFDQIKEMLIEAIKTQNPDADKVVDLLMIAKYLEKIGDHAVNIGEWALFQITGDMERVRLL